MSQKEKIISLLKVNQIMTQSELAEDIYEDRFHTSNIYSALMSLVDNDIVTRSGAFLSYSFAHATLNPGC